MSEGELAELRRTVGELRDTLIELRTLSNSEGLRCQYRETIARAANNAGRLDAMEDCVTNLRVDVVRISTVAGLSGGGGMAVMGGILYAIAKAAGWV